jgi:hypothetical protein
MGHVEDVCNHVEAGDSIGCEGGGLQQQTMIPIYGDQVIDMIQLWIKDKSCIGPLKREAWSDFTMSPLKGEIKAKRQGSPNS